VVLFGSYARGRQTVASDIDLLVVYAGAVRGDAYALVRHTLGLRHLEPHVYAEEEYAQVSATLERMIQDGITVYSAGVAGDCQPGRQRHGKEAHGKHGAGSKKRGVRDNR
jgi:hypothetical protein